MLPCINIDPIVFTSCGSKCEHKAQHNSYTYQNCVQTLSTVRTRQVLRISYFWLDWNYFVRLGVLHPIFSTKRSRFYVSPKICLKFLIIRLLTSVAYCSSTCTIYKHSYHTAVMLLSDLDFVALNNEHIRWYS